MISPNPRQIRSFEPEVAENHGNSFINNCLDVSNNVCVDTNNCLDDVNNCSVVSIHVMVDVNNCLVGVNNCLVDDNHVSVGHNKSLVGARKRSGGHLRGSAMFSVLAAVVIIMIATVFLMYGGWGPKKDGSGRADGGGKTTMGAARLAAKDTVCRENLKQCRMALSLHRTANDENPGSLEELKIGKSFYRCEVGQEPYNYDSQTGTVACPHPGHEKY